MARQRRYKEGWLVVSFITAPPGHVVQDGRGVQVGVVQLVRLGVADEHQQQDDAHPGTRSIYKYLQLW